MNRNELFSNVETILVIDWPSREVPETLARAGFHVVVRGGPGPTDFSVWEWKSGEIVARPLGHAPGRAGLIYAYRPLSELPGILAAAKQLGASTIWTQSGLSALNVKDPKGCWISPEDLSAASGLVHAAGLNYVTAPYIVDVAREWITQSQQSSETSAEAG